MTAYEQEIRDADAMLLEAGIDNPMAALWMTNYERADWPRIVAHEIELRDGIAKEATDGKADEV